MATAGAVVSIYPGLVYLPEMFQNDDDVKAVFYTENGSANDWAMSRYDQTVVDGMTCEMTPPNPFGP